MANKLKVVDQDNNLYLVQIQAVEDEVKYYVDGSTNKVSRCFASTSEIDALEDSTDFQTVAGIVQNAYLLSATTLENRQELACLFAYLDTARQLPTE